MNLRSKLRRVRSVRARLSATTAPARRRSARRRSYEDGARATEGGARRRESEERGVRGDVPDVQRGRTRRERGVLARDGRPNARRPRAGEHGVARRLQKSRLRCRPRSTSRGVRTEWSEGVQLWTAKCAYVLGIEGVLDLPETHFHGLLEQAGADLSTQLSQCNLGVFYDCAKRYDKALEWYMKGARQGCMVCESNIGMSTERPRRGEKHRHGAGMVHKVGREGSSPSHKTRPAASSTTRDDTKRRSSGSRNRPLKATLTLNPTSGSATRTAKA